MTPRDLTFAALDYINVATIATASTRQLQRIARDLTATLQEIYSLAPKLYRQRLGAVLAAPVTVTVAVVNGDTAMTSSDSLVDGATIQVAGDATFNEVRIVGSNKTLVLPFRGTSGTVTATMWGDVTTLGSTIDRVIGSVRLNESKELAPRDNRDDALTRPHPVMDYGRRLTGRAVITTRTQGEPYAYWVEPVLLGAATTHVSHLRLRVYPLPKTSYTLGFDARLRAPRLGPLNLGNDGSDSAVSLVLPADMIEAIVLPMFLKRWAGSPWFRNKEAQTQISDDDKAARGLLIQYRPQQAGNRRISAPI